MNKNISLPRGTSDILPPETLRWQSIENTARALFQIYGYKEIRTPMFEQTELFARSMGQTSDVVSKQMLQVASQRALEDQTEKDSFSLRPENTASVVRSYIENSLNRKENISKLYYIGSMFRGERPQKGRLRQFNQIGVEAIGEGSSSPFLDAEVISLAVHLLKYLGLEQFKLKLNTLGTPEDKENFAKFLRQELNLHLSKLCFDCQNRFERNVFRVLDCKVRECKAIVSQLKLNHSYLSEESQKYFVQVKEALKEIGIAFEEDHFLVRGLDYYTHTVFEITGAGLGSQDALGAGGRYNNLVSQLGGSPADAVGFAVGVERIILALNKSEEVLSPGGVFLVTLSEPALRKGFEILNALRYAGVPSEMSFKESSIKSQMRQADKVKSRFVLILGEDELKSQQIACKDMQSGEQEFLALDKVIVSLKEKLNLK